MRCKDLWINALLCGLQAGTEILHEPPVFRYARLVPIGGCRRRRCGFAGERSHAGRPEEAFPRLLARNLWGRRLGGVEHQSAGRLHGNAGAPSQLRRRLFGSISGPKGKAQAVGDGSRPLGCS